MTLAPTRIAAGFATLVVGGSLLAGCSSAPTSASTPSSAPAATTTSASAAQTSATAPTSATTASTAAATSASSASASAPAAAAGLTMATVATHNTASSCWTVINKNVYDLTAWINVHPGGATPIKSLCGIDATAKFAEQHGTEKDPNNRLATFKKGALAG